MAAKLEMPPGGARARMGAGRTRSAQIALRFQPRHELLLDQLATAEGVTRTVVIERALEGYAQAQGFPLPEGDVTPDHPDASAIP
jgi:hypothetical protein